MLASLPDDELDERLAGIADLPVLTARSHRTVDELRRDLELTRERGHSLDDGQNTRAWRASVWPCQVVRPRRRPR